MLLFTLPKNKCSQMRFEGLQANSPWTTHISELGAVYMPVEAGNRIMNGTAESCHTVGVNCSGCYKWVLCSTKSVRWVVSVLLREGISVVLCRQQTLWTMQRLFWRQAENKFNCLFVQVASRQSTGSYTDWWEWVFLLAPKFTFLDPKIK